MSSCHKAAGHTWGILSVGGLVLPTTQKLSHLRDNKELIRKQEKLNLSHGQPIEAELVALPWREGSSVQKIQLSTSC